MCLMPIGTFISNRYTGVACSIADYRRLLYSSFLFLPYYTYRLWSHFITYTSCRTLIILSISVANVENIFSTSNGFYNIPLCYN